MNRNQKNDCAICGGSYSSLNKSTHMKTKKHIDAIKIPIDVAPIPIDLPIVPIVLKKEPPSEIDEAFTALCSTLSDLQKLQIMNFMSKMSQPPAVVVSLPKIEPEIDPLYILDCNGCPKNTGMIIYSELKGRDTMSSEELEIYLQYHRIDDMPLSKEAKDFQRSLVNEQGIWSPY